MGDVLIIGAGLFGLTVAERLASAGAEVLILEARNHIGGNAWAEDDQATGIEVHQFGAHIFHTSNERVWAYVNRFTRFSEYRHRVWALRDGRIHPLPFGLAALSSLLGRYLTPAEATEFLIKDRDDSYRDDHLEGRALSLIGRTMYEAFVRDYTTKQWATPPAQLPADVITRLPFRLSYDTGYFTDRFQGLPVPGYRTWLERLADHPHITVACGQRVTPRELPHDLPVVWTGPIDELLDYRYGTLGWRTIDTDLYRFPQPDYQGTSVINYSDLSRPFTRAIEYRHLRPERSYTGEETIVGFERSRWAGPGDEPYYPVARPADREKLIKYRADAAREFPNVTLGGRLGTYHYLDMHMAIGSALTVADKITSGSAAQGLGV